ncbi:hypothetical protein H2204_015120 [Knufia peltigerae]|uniref:Uncharacterized protein n=1 Tax=Knufia peltigerae TaxID=1002370 RepID=A0AA38XE98_9EURO|nr:hypothetical protein H2204_015120 [Knufia peltigerae]
MRWLINYLRSRFNDRDVETMPRTSSDVEDDDTPRFRKKQRKQRPCYSCTECRRLKIRDQTDQLREQESDADHPNPAQAFVGPVHGSPTSHQTLHEPGLQQGRPLHHSHSQPDGLTPARAKPILAVGAPLYMVLTAIADTLFDPPYGILNRVGAVINPSLQPVNNHEQNASHGTLVLDQGGRSKYLGPTAGSEWLKDIVTQDVSASPSNICAPSPEAHQASMPRRPDQLPSVTGSNAFPFAVSVVPISTQALLSRLPPREEAWFLVEAYYRYCAWQ